MEQKNKVDAALRLNVVLKGRKIQINIALDNNNDETVIEP